MEKEIHHTAHKSLTTTGINERSPISFHSAVILAGVSPLFQSTTTILPNDNGPAQTCITLVRKHLKKIIKF